MARPKDASEKKEEAKEKTPEKKAPKEAKATGSDSKGADKKKEMANGDKPGWLSAVRPRQRSIFLVVFLAFCAWIVVFHDQCDVPKKKREDCGYMGITTFECRTVGCLKAGGGQLQKISTTVKREQGNKFGMSVQKIEKKDWLTVTEIKSDGAIQTHNNALPDGEEKVEVGDSIVRINGATSTKSMKKALSSTDSTEIKLDIRRSMLPSFLRPYLHVRGKPNMIESILTGPGLQKFAASFGNMLSLGFGAWLLSGYSPMSLPLFYLTPSAIVAFIMARCCHDNNVPGGVPHCYKGRSDTPRVAFDKMWNRTNQVVANFRKDPKKWSMSFVKPPQLF